MEDGGWRVEVGDGGWGMRETHSTNIASTGSMLFGGGGAGVNRGKALFYFYFLFFIFYFLNFIFISLSLSVRVGSVRFGLVKIII
jgi:hypothetical protein